MSSSNFSSGGGTIFAGDYNAARDININIVTNVPKATSEDKKVSDWFSRLNFWTTYQDTLGRRHEGTGAWFLQHEQFVDWKQAGHRILLCTGIPGSGKTVISAIVIEHLLQNRMVDETIAVGCIYCNYKDRQPAVNLLSSLTKQLLQQIPALSHRIKSIFEDHNGRQDQPGLNEYHDILQSVSHQFSKVFLIVDALDECDKNEAKNLIKILSKVSSLRLLIFSRDVPNVKHQFSDCPQLEVQASERDIESYLDAHVQEESELSELIQEDPTLYDKIRATIVEKSRGMFLLAHLHFESLVQYDNSDAICTALDSLPTELYISYGEAMKRIEKQPEPDHMRAKQVLLWVSCTERPLKMDELREALAVRSDSSTLNRGTLPAGSRLITVCAGLVRFDQQSQIIKLAHETIQQYLELRRPELFPDAQKIIATACISYLSFDTFQVGVCSTDQELETLLKHNMFLDYASRYWGIHIRGELEEQFTEFSLKLLQNDLTISCSSQVMLADSKNFSGYSQMVPWKVSGAHIGAHFNLACTLAALFKIQSKPDMKDSNGRTPLSWAASLGNSAAVQLLMHHEGVNVNSEDCHGQTPLARAAEEGHENVVNLLVLHEAIVIDCRDIWGMTPLAWAVTGGHLAIINLLLDQEASIDTTDDDGETAFYKAVERKDEGVIRLLLQRRAQIPEDDDCGIRALDWAIGNRHWEIIQLLVQRGVNLNEKIYPDTTVLNKAVSRGQRDTVEFLVKHGAAINPRKAHDPAPLRIAVAHGHNGILKTLLELGADAKVKDQQGMTLVHLAVASDHEDLLPMLVAYGVPIDATNKNGQTALWLAAENHRADLFPLLVGCGANINVANNIGVTIIHWAVALNMWQTIRNLKDLGANLEARDIKGRTPLRYAVESGNEKTVALLVELGANTEAKDIEGKTPFRYAVENNRRMLRLLADLGFSKNAADNLEETSLHWAAKNDRADLVRELISLGASTKVKDSEGRTALHLAAKNGHMAVVKTMTDLGTDLDTTDRFGRTSLHTAALSKHLKVVEILLRAGTARSSVDSWDDSITPAILTRDSDLLDSLFAHECKFDMEGIREYLINVDDFSWFADEIIRKKSVIGSEAIRRRFGEYTPLHFAAEHGRTDVVNDLLRAECFSADARTKDGWTPVHLAARNDQTLSLRRFLIEDSVNINTQTDNGLTILHIAAQRSNFYILEVILQRKHVIVDIKANEGWTPLHFAAQNGYLRMVQRLLKACPSCADAKLDDGRTPAQVASDSGYPHIATAINLNPRHGS